MKEKKPSILTISLIVVALVIVVVLLYLLFDKILSNDKVVENNKKDMPQKQTVTDMYSISNTSDSLILYSDNTFDLNIDENNKSKGTYSKKDNGYILKIKNKKECTISIEPMGLSTKCDTIPNNLNDSKDITKYLFRKDNFKNLGDIFKEQLMTLPNNNELYEPIDNVDINKIGNCFSNEKDKMICQVEYTVVAKTEGGDLSSSKWAEPNGSVNGKRISNEKLVTYKINNDSYQYITMNDVDK